MGYGSLEPVDIDGLVRDPETDLLLVFIVLYTINVYRFIHKLWVS